MTSQFKPQEAAFAKSHIFAHKILDFLELKREKSNFRYYSNNFQTSQFLIPYVPTEIHHLQILEILECYLALMNCLYL